MTQSVATESMTSDSMPSGSIAPEAVQEAVQEVVQHNIPAELVGLEFPPADLWSDEPPLESDLHRRQIILSDSTDVTDRGLKKQIYQDTFRTPDYFWFDPVTLEFQGFHLVDGEYQSLHPTEEGWLWSQQLELYLGIHDRKLRFFTPEGQPIPLYSRIKADRSILEDNVISPRWRMRSQLGRARVKGTTLVK